MKKPESVKRSMYSPNLGFNDRQLRLVAGTLMIVAPMFMAPETMGMWTVMLLAAIPIITSAIIGWDPLYALFAKTTYVEREDDIKQRNWSYANLGIIDRGLRVSVGVALLAALMAMDTMTVNMVLSLLAIPIVTTAIIAWDPLYAMLGINSFGSRMDVKAAEPEIEEKTLATFYVLPEEEVSHEKIFPKAA